MVTSSEPRSEEARAGADILDLDRYMRGSRPARRAPRHTSGSGLVVDGGAVGRLPSSSASSGSEPSDKRFSHDSGLSDTSYSQQRPNRHKRVVSSIGSNSAKTVERPRVKKSSGEAIDRRRAKASGEAIDRRRAKASGGEKERRGKRSRGDARRGSSESNRSFRETLERALRDQQAQIARVAALCERQRSERTSERHSDKPSERRNRRTRPESGGAEHTTSGSTDFSSSSSSLDPLKRRVMSTSKTSECRTYKIIMSKLDELNRMFAQRRALPAAPAPPNRPAHPREDSSVTVSDKVVGTESQQHTGRQAKQRATSVVAAGAVDIPPRNNVITESVVRNEDREISAPASEKAMPGRFHLDDPVRLYQQAKRLETRERRGSCSSSPGSGSAGSRGSARGSGGSQGSAKGSPSLCALCRCYWSVARRYVAAQLNAVRE